MYCFYMCLCICEWQFSSVWFCFHVCSSLQVALQEKLLSCFQRSVTCLICVCSPQVKWNRQYQGWSCSRFSWVLSCWHFYLPPTPTPSSSFYTFTYFCLFIFLPCVSASSVAILICFYTPFPHTFLSPLLSTSISLSLSVSLSFLSSHPDNDRAKECQSDGRRVSPGQDASRTRSPLTR